MNDELKRKFTSDLQKLVGKECWGIVEGEGTGSIIDFKLGEKILMEKPIENEYLPRDLQLYNSEFSLFVQSVWRVDSRERVICGAWTEHEFVHQEMAQIIGQTVKTIELFEPAFDLKITFSNELKLNIFCDQTNDVDENDNYSYFTPEIIYTVAHKSSLETSEHDK